MSDQTAAWIESLSDFTQAIQNEEYAKAIELAPQLFKNVVEDDDSSLSTAIYECYIQALLQEEKFEEVLELWNPMSSSSSSSSSSKKQQGKKSSSSKTIMARPVGLEHLRIYALYRLERYEKARELAAAAAATSKSSSEEEEDESSIETLRLHLLAQSLHHLEESGPAMDLYSKLLQTDDCNQQQQMQILTNLCAVACANATPYVRSTNRLEEQRPAMDGLLERLGQAPSNGNDDDDDDDTADDDLPDLAYNLATYELLTSPTEVYHWHQVMQKAVKSVQDNNPKEVALMKSNLDWSSRFWNGNSTASSSNGAVVPMNQLSSTAKLVALTNRALMAGSMDHHSSKAAADALRLVPTTANLKNKLTPLQMRLATYNRALLQYRAGLYDDCRTTCQQLVDSVKIPSSHAQKKKQRHTAAANIAQPTLAPEDAAWWESRVVVLQALCRRASAAAAAATEKEEEEEPGNGQKDKSDSKNNNNLLQTALDKISKFPESPVRDSALAYLQLHQAALEQQDETKTSSNNTIDKTITLLKSLPPSMQKRRAVVATLASLYQQQNKPEKVQQLLKEMGDDQAYADFLMGQEQYKEAADLYQKAAAAAAASGDDNDESRYLTAQARYVQALSFVDPAKAQELWLQIRPKINLDSSNRHTDEISGADLEVRELPRLKSSAHHARSSLDAMKDTAATAMTTTGTTTTTGKPKKSHQAVLRQRARKRDEYLAQLDKKGLRRVANPDPERWLPKYERSYNRRRRHRNQQQQQQQQHKGAQGGVSEKDAAKLDVAARQAARNKNDSTTTDTATTSTTTRSTAQTAVSTGGPRKGGHRR